MGYPAQRLLERPFEVAPRTEPAYFAGRVILFGALMVVGAPLMTATVADNRAGESVLHLINLPFHEAGHIIFMPFGDFMTALGGSLTQVLVPLVCLRTFFARTRDMFAASVALWWTGQNLLDLAPYIDDARSLRLGLLGGRTGAEVEGHDWEKILQMLGWLHHDHAIAAGAHRLGTTLMLAALAWGGIVLVRQGVRLGRPAAV